MGIHENKWVKLLTFLWTHKTGLFIRTVAEAGLLPCGRSPEIGSWEHLAGRCASQASQTFSPRWVSQESKALLCHVCILNIDYMYPITLLQWMQPTGNQERDCFLAWHRASVRASPSLTFSKAFSLPVRTLVWSSNEGKERLDMVSAMYNLCVRKKRVNFCCI